jgi:penicillin-binding protein 1A
VVGSVVIALVAANYIVDWSLAQVDLPPEVELSNSARVYDRDGNLIATYRSEVTRFSIDTTELPDHVREAVIAAEDRDFYEHEGLSFGGVLRAAWQNLASGRVEQGGSTITQQYAKNALLEDPSRTVERKAREAILAIKLERRYSKDEILDRYLNTVYFGRGAYGIEAAARTYFGRNAGELSLAQAAFLAGAIPSPGRYQEGGEAAIERRNYVLSAMEQEGYITSEENERAANRKLRFELSHELRRKRQPAAYFLEWIRKDFLYPHFGECLYTCGLKIHTTLDMEMQKAAEEAVASTLTEEDDPQAAVVSMTPHGRVRALIGGRDFTNVKAARGFNYATDGVRQAGSSFKPFTLLAAIEENISPQSYFSGESPKTIEDPACTGPDGVWEPENYGGASYGTMPLEQATHNSVNTVYAELISEIGPEKVADLLQRFGFRAPTEKGKIAPVCSLSLGTLDVSVMQMARAYAGLAGRGHLPKVVPIVRVEDSDGNCLLGYGTPRKLKCEERIKTRPTIATDENTADVATEVLSGVLTSGTATGAQIGRPAAGKTGTTQDSRDAWFAGYVPQLTTVVWMGHPLQKGPDERFGTDDDVSPLMSYCSDPVRCRPVHGIEVTGGSFPAEIWQSFMLAALADFEVEFFQTPLDQPDIVLNPPPPPPPPDDDRDDRGGGDGDGGDDDSGPGNGNGNGPPGRD